jgi:hypothetical protein
MGKAFSSVVKSGKPLDESYGIAKNALQLSGLNIKQDDNSGDGFVLMAKEPLQWTGVNWPVTVGIRGGVADGETLLNVCAEVTFGQWSMDQDDNTQEILKKVVSAIAKHCH